MERLVLLPGSYFCDTLTFNVSLHCLNQWRMQKIFMGGV